MLTKKEQDFISYWEQNRNKKKKFLRQFSIGLPLGVFAVVAIFVNLLSGWYKKAEMVLRGGGSSIFLTIFIAIILIAVFFAVFSSKHKWDMNEQYYNELKAKMEKEASNNAAN